jgi:hypothetical protein
MEISNQTPFKIATLLWEDFQARPKLTVAVKATFEIKNDGTLLAAPEQLPVFASDVPTGDGPQASVRFESDMVPFKPRADVVVVGKAYAPGRQAVRSLEVGLRVGNLQRWLRLFGDRRWKFPSRLLLFPALSRPEPFVTMDLLYERAFGGIDTAAAKYCRENLAGRGFIGKKSKKSIHGKYAPNLENPKDLIRSWRSKPNPVGFGFYGRGWMPRLRYAGTYDENYRKHIAPKVPPDFSYAFFNGAHPDLQVEGYLKGDEPVELLNLSPGGRLAFRLPGIRPQITVARWKASPHEWIEQNSTADRRASLEEVPCSEQPLEIVLDTLVLMPDEGFFYEVFRGVCPLNGLDKPEVARITVKT